MSEPATGGARPAGFPPPLDRLAGREFSFYPSIESVDENVWRLVEANWSEFLVENQGDRSQVWVPRRYLGEVSSTDRPVMIVGLNRPLERKAGQVWPLQKRVIEMPRVPAPLPDLPGEQPQAIARPDSLLGSAIRLDASEKSLGKLIVLGLGGALVAVALAVFLFRGARSGDMIQFKGVVQENLGLGPEDDYFAVVRKLGEPQADRYKADGESIQYRVMVYPSRRLNVVLAGREKNEVRYIGALDADWKVVDSVTQKGGSTTYAVLSRLPRF
jgi:hypothetical protein